jgi:hypothetical protein
MSVSWSLSATLRGIHQLGDTEYRGEHDEDVEVAFLQRFIFSSAIISGESFFRSGQPRDLTI